MEFYLGLIQIIGVHTILGLSAYVVLQTGQVTMAQAGFFSIGASVAGMLTVLAGWHIIPAMLVGAVAGAGVACLVGFPALRVKGLMLVVATIAFGEFIKVNVQSGRCSEGSRVQPQETQYENEPP